jgi:hypothetical protein
MGEDHNPNWNAKKSGVTAGSMNSTKTCASVSD